MSARPRVVWARVAVCLAIAAATAGQGCLYRQPVKYSLKDVKPVAASPFTGRTLAVKEFKDTRPPQAGQSIWKKIFGRPVPQDSHDGRRWFFNTNDNYKDKRAAPWVSRMVVKHLKAARLFKEVKLSGEDSARSDLLLEGRIQQFRGEVEPSGDAEALEMSSMQFGAVGGLLGALMISRIKTEYHGKTVLTDLKLSDVGTGKVLWEGTAEGEVSGRAMADTDGTSAYYHADDSLKEATKSLVEQLRKCTAEAMPVGSAP